MSVTDILRQARLRARFLAALLRERRGLRLTVGFLLAANAAFVLLHVVSLALLALETGAALTDGRRFILSKDGSYPEIFGYAQAASCVAALLVCWFHAREAMYAFWSGIFAFVVLDDSLELHERLGSALAFGLTLPALPGLRPQDTGELLVWGTVAATILVLGAATFRWASARARSDGIVLVGLLALLAFFAVVVDLVHVATSFWVPSSNLVFAVFEDGGEMLVLAAACAATLAMAVDLKAPLAEARTARRSPSLGI